MVKVLWLAGILLVQGAAATQNSVFRVAGTVVREDNQDPARALNGDRVVLRSSSGPSTIVEIGAGGSFEFTNVRAGVYQIVAGPMVTMEPLTVVVTDKDVTGLRLVIPDAVAVSGKVTVENGGPQPRFQIAFARTGGPATAAPPVNVTAAAAFNASLSSGEYRVTSSGLPNGYSLKSMTAGAADLLAQPLKITSGNSETIAITLGVSSPAPWVEVSGRVTIGSAMPASVVRVAINGPAAAEALTALADADGSFEFLKVLPGSYTALAFSSTSVSTPVTLTVGAADVTNVAISLPSPKEVNGRVAVQGNLPLPRIAFSLAQIAGIPASSANLPVNLQPDGSFKIALPAGERQISVVPGTAPPGYKLASFTYGTTDLLANPLRVAMTDNAELRVTFDASALAPVTVSGRVTGLLTTQGVRVVMTNPFFGSVEATVNSDGSFTFSKVLPGNYNARLSLSGLSAGRGVVVGNRDVTDVIIAYPREFIVTGHTIVEGGAAGAVSPQVTLQAEDVKNDVKNGAGSRVSNIVNSGVIRLNVKDGEYNVSLRSVPAGYQLKSIMYGTTDLQKEPLRIDGPVTWEIIVRLTASIPPK